MTKSNIGSSKNKGFTLVELLLVVALTALAVGVTGDILISLIRGYNKTQVINEIEQSANFVSQKMNKELRNATEITQIGTYTTPLSAGNAGNEIIFINNSGIAIGYKVENGILYREYDGGGYNALTTNSPPNGVTVNCSTNCFTLLAIYPQVVQIQITVEQSGSDVVFEGDINIEDTIVVRDTY